MNKVEPDYKLLLFALGMARGLLGKLKPHMGEQDRSMLSAIDEIVKTNCYGQIVKKEESNDR